MKCDRCNSEVELYARGRGLFYVYRIHGIVQMCESCIKVADSIVGYWGKKKPEDIQRLKDFLNSGKNIRNKYSALMNAGYIEK